VPVPLTFSTFYAILRYILKENIMLTISVTDALLVFDLQPLRQPLLAAEAEAAKTAEVKESEAEDDRD